MKVVIGGANGLLGRKLAAALRARGDEVVALVRRAGKATFASGVREAVWDGKSAGAWTQEVDGADAVVNLAGANLAAKRWTEEYKGEIVASRIDSTRALVDAVRAARQRPRVFVGASAVGFYGERGDEELTEASPGSSGFVPELVARWEAEALAAASLGLRAVVVRTGVVLSTEDGALPKMLLPFRLFAGGPLGTGRQWFPWIHEADELALLLFAIDDERVAGPINAAAPQAVRMSDFARALGGALHRPSWAPVPRFALRIAVGQVADDLLKSERVVPRKALDLGFRFRYERIDDALAGLLRGPQAESAAEARR